MKSLTQLLFNFIQFFPPHTEYVEMTDLLREFTEPAVMDIKMGIRYVSIIVSD